MVAESCSPGDVHGVPARQASAVAACIPDLKAYYISSLPKCLWSSLRPALVMAPDPMAADAVIDHLGAAGMGGSPLLYGLSEQWIRSGMAEP